MKVPVVTQIMKANDSVASENRRAFAEHGVVVVNVMASPGAGKTSTLLATHERLGGIRMGVVEGDVASTIDADKMAERGIPVVQINTGGSCHLDAPMIRSSLEHLPLDELDVLFIENVGNLICPASYDLGHDHGVVVASVAEGHDKPYKYPGIFARTQAVVLNKWDLAEVFEFDLDYFEHGVRMVNPDAPIFVVSCRTGEGMEEWVGWVRDRAGVAAPAVT